MSFSSQLAESEEELCQVYRQLLLCNAWASYSLVKKIS